MERRDSVLVRVCACVRRSVAGMQRRDSSAERQGGREKGGAGGGRGGREGERETPGAVYFPA